MLPYSNLSTSEKSNLLDLIFDETQTVPSVQSKFNESFPAARYPAVCLHLSSQCKEFISSLEGAALVSSLAIVDSMRRADCRAAKTLFYDILIDLDRAIRKDICFSEQINYSTKESKESKKSAAAILSDGHRIHTAAKVCAFELLTSHPAPAEKISSIVAKKQSEIDSKLDAFSSQQSESSSEEKGLKLLGERGAGPALSEMMKCWEDEYEKRYTGDSWGVSAVFNPLPSNRSALTVHTATVKIPSLPVTTGELRYLLPIPSSFLLFDDQEHSVEWMQAHTLLNKARSTVLSKDDQNTLKKVITAEILQHIGVNESLLSDLANQSLEICAVVLQNLPSATSGAFIQSLLKSNAPSENIDQIFVLAANALKQINVRTLIYDRIQELKDSSDKEKLLSFSTCLHHLMTKDAQENKEIYIADPVKKNLEQLFQASTIPEVASRWEEIKKVSFA